MTAAERWRDQLEAWALPDGFADRAPGADPWRLDVGSFVDRALARRHEDLGGDGHDETPADRTARAALGDGGVVLDVGCGAGAATCGIGSLVTHGIGVDERADMLEAYAQVLDRCGIEHAQVHGRWPDVASTTPRADVAVAHHVVHNVWDIVPFLGELDAHARRRVVLELPTRHPLSVWNEYWWAIHDLDRPTGPTSDDLVAVCSELGLGVHTTTREQPVAASLDREARLDHLARHLCLRDDERDLLLRVDDRLGRPMTRQVATIWWDPDDAP